MNKQETFARLIMTELRQLKTLSSMSKLDRDVSMRKSRREALRVSMIFNWLVPLRKYKQVACIQRSGLEDHVRAGNHHYEDNKNAKMECGSCGEKR